MSMEQQIHNENSPGKSIANTNKNDQDNREFMYAAKLYDKHLKMKKKISYSSTMTPLPIH